MELQIQDLVSSIKKEGIEAAQAEADSIIARAKEEAAAILAEARAEADKAREKAAGDIEMLKDSARVNAEQARRDAELSFKNSVQKEFEKILAFDIQKTVSGETLATLIKAVLTDEDPAAYRAEVAEVTEGLKGELAEQVKNGLEIRVSDRIKGGFRLASKDGSGYFDCSDEEITTMLKPFFSDLNI